MKRKTPYVSVNLTETARGDLRRAALALTSDAGRRLSMSAVLGVAQDHREELLDRLRRDA